jgi:uracil permease
MNALRKYWDATSVAQTAHRGESIPSLLIKGLQSMLVMFGATIIVPLMLGMNPQVTMFGMGVGTLIFLFMTKGKSPLTMGSSFAFMIGVLGVISDDGPLSHIAERSDRLPYALGGIIFAGGVYLLFSVLVKIIGAEKFMRILPHAVTGPTVVLIGVTLAPHALTEFSRNWLLGGLTLLIIIIMMVFGRGKAKAFPILIGLVGAYIVAVVLSVVGGAEGAHYINFAAVADADLFGLPPFMSPRFALVPILMLVPFSLATVAENIADHVIVGQEMNEDLLRGKPGLARTLFADGFQSMCVAAFGTPMNTTYSENVGLLIITKVFSSLVVAIGAGFAILLGLSPAFAEIIRSIPPAIIGGASIMLYGMIASIGMRNVKEHVNLNLEKYLIIMSVMLVVGIGMRFVTGDALTRFTLEIAGESIRLDRMNLPIAIIMGVILNAVLPNSSTQK